ncbi:MAG: hypothetical protein BGN82_07565 [Alphaproteobacteria bacterium 65-7]|nr:MAG: hypothetical protein BGN82_07565 [Alphaproteobacteria bacterium 65-7]
MTRLALAFLVLLLSFMPARAWGPQGHEIVALLAQQELTPAAARQVSALLGGGGMMVHDSNWADEIRDRRPETSRWHYVNIPLNAPGYVAVRDCPAGNCVVAQIAAAQRRLADRDLPTPRRAEALRFLIHLVGDIHQPLHAADDKDRGGNAIRVMLGGKRTTLHGVWDGEIVRMLGPDSGRAAAAIARNTSEAQRNAWRGGDPAAWANDSLAVARREVYRIVNGRRDLRLNRAYLESQRGTVQVQMAKAGLRLAWMLNASLR